MDNNLLNDRIGRLKDWSERESLNEILFNAFSALNDYAKGSFDALTKKIRDEALLYESPPVIKVAVCATSDLDKHVLFFPVATGIPTELPNYLTTVFTELDYPTMQLFIKETYPATIETDTGIIKARISVKYSEKYLKNLKQLYFIYSENNLPWATVNAVYFYKFLDVCCTPETKIDIDARFLESIKSLSIDWGSYQDKIHYDKHLLWNVDRIIADVAQNDPKPVYDAIQYEHVLKDLSLDDHKYLVCPLKDRFQCFRRGQEMFVNTYTKRLEEIELLRIVGTEDAESPLYLPARTNKKKQGLVESLARGRYMPTQGEAERIINSLDMGNAPILKDIQIIPYTHQKLMRYKGIEFNHFVESTVILPDRKLLLFSFSTNQPNVDKLWAYEEMYYILSELQMYFYEYHVVGELV